MAVDSGAVRPRVSQDRSSSSSTRRRPGGCPAADLRLQDDLPLARVRRDGGRPRGRSPRDKKAQALTPKEEDEAPA
eukprot:12844645-Alexandrium_andersonii.AAC.1